MLSKLDFFRQLLQELETTDHLTQVQFQQLFILSAAPSIQRWIHLQLSKESDTMWLAWVACLPFTYEAESCFLKEISKFIDQSDNLSMKKESLFAKAMYLHFENENVTQCVDLFKQLESMGHPLGRYFTALYALNQSRRVEQKAENTTTDGRNAGLVSLVEEFLDVEQAALNTEFIASWETKLSMLKDCCLSGPDQKCPYEELHKGTLREVKAMHRKAITYCTREAAKRGHIESLLTVAAGERNESTILEILEPFLSVGDTDCVAFMVKYYMQQHKTDDAFHVLFRHDPEDNRDLAVGFQAADELLPYAYKLKIERDEFEAQVKDLKVLKSQELTRIIQHHVSDFLA